MRSKTDIYPRINAVAESIEKGESTEAIIKDYTARWAVAKRTVEWYISLAKPMAEERLKARQSIIEEVRKDAITKAAQEQIMSDLELEAILCSIARGEPMASIAVFKDKTKKVMLRPTFFDRVNAIDRLFKKRGAYSEDKRLADNKTYIVQYNIQKTGDIEHIENT